MDEKVITIVPHQTFDIVPDYLKVLRFWIRSNGSKPSILSVYPTNPSNHQAQRKDHGARSRYGYHAMFNIPPYLQFWPFTSYSTVSLHSGQWAEDSLLKGYVPPIVSARISHPLLPWGSGAIKLSQNVSSCSRKQKRCVTHMGLRKPRWRAKDGRLALNISDGLRKGQWGDPILPLMQNLDSKWELRWQFGLDRSNVKISIGNQNYQWLGKSDPNENFVVLLSGKEILALYMPGWTRLGSDRQRKKCKDAKKRKGKLCIMTEVVNKPALDHIILVCLAIEEQVSRA
jgi:hypothetical protein